MALGKSVIFLSLWLTICQAQSCLFGLFSGSFFNLLVSFSLPTSFFFFLKLFRAFTLQQMANIGWITRIGFFFLISLIFLLSPFQPSFLFLFFLFCFFFFLFFFLQMDGSDVCSWEGVECANGVVYSLDLVMNFFFFFSLFFSVPSLLFFCFFVLIAFFFCVGLFFLFVFTVIQ